MALMLEQMSGNLRPPDFCPFSTVIVGTAGSGKIFLCYLLQTLSQTWCTGLPARPHSRTFHPLLALEGLQVLCASLRVSVCSESLPVDTCTLYSCCFCQLQGGGLLKCHSPPEGCRGHHPTPSRKWGNRELLRAKGQLPEFPGLLEQNIINLVA